MSPDDLNQSPCGGNHELACGRFLVDAHWLRAEDCDEALRRALSAHMQECAPCRHAYALESSIKALMARGCGPEQAPAQLRQMVVQRIRSMISIEHTSTVVTDGSTVVQSSSTTVRMMRPSPPAEA